MRVPKGLTVKFDQVERGRVFFTVRATKFYLFKTILRIGGQNLHHPLTAGLIFAFAFYYLAVE
ncbi:hypothetical protein ES707_00345 [subsurface metagenome]